MTCTRTYGRAPRHPAEDLLMPEWKQVVDLRPIFRIKYVDSKLDTYLDYIIRYMRCLNGWPQDKIPQDA